LPLVGIKIEFGVIPLYDLHCTHSCLLKICEIWGHLELLNVLHGSERSCPRSNPTIINIHVTNVAFKLVLLSLSTFFRVLVLVLVIFIVFFILSSVLLFLVLLVVLLFNFLNKFFFVIIVLVLRNLVSLALIVQLLKKVCSTSLVVKLAVLSHLVGGSPVIGLSQLK